MLLWFLWSLGFILIHVCSLQVGTGWAEPAKSTDERRIVTLAPVVTKGLENPLFLTQADDGSGRLFVVEQPGRIRVLEGHALLPAQFLDITKQVLSGGERGLLGLAFHPDYRHNGRFFVNYTRKPDGATVLAEYHKGATATSASQDERILLLVPQPYPNHNGGMVAFGPDGYLYVGLGDGGSKGETTAPKIPRTCSGRFCGSMWIEVIRIAYRRTTHSPKQAAARKYMPLGYGTLGAFHSTAKPGTSGSLMSDNTNGKKSIWSPAVAITAGA